MASIRFSAVGGEIKGKINGTVFQGGKSGPIVKRLIHRSFVRVLAIVYGMMGTTFTWTGSDALGLGAIPCTVYRDGSHVSNPLANNQRVMLSKIASQWKSLTQEQRDAWNASAVNFPFRNRFGDLYTGSGFQVWMELTLNLVKVGEAANLFPPAPSSPLLPVITQPDADGTNPGLFNFPEGIPAGQKVIVFSSVGQSSGKTTKGKNLKLIGVLENDVEATDFNLRYMWQLFFGPYQTQTTVTYVFKAVDTATGTISAEQTFGVPVTAAMAGASVSLVGETIDFGDQATGGVSFLTPEITAFANGSKITGTITGANAGEFSFTDAWPPGDPAIHVLDITADQWGNITPQDFNLAWTAGAIGAKVGTITWTDENANVVGTTAITANSTA